MGLRMMLGVGPPLLLSYNQHRQYVEAAYAWLQYHEVDPRRLPWLYAEFLTRRAEQE